MDAIQSSASGRKVLGGAIVGSYVLAYVYLQAFWMSYGSAVGYWILAFTLFFFLGGECLYRALCRLKHTYQADGDVMRQVPQIECTERKGKEHVFFLVSGVLLAVAIFIYNITNRRTLFFMQWNHSDGVILIYANLLLHAVAVYWVLCRFGLLYRGKTTAWVAVDLLGGLFVLPFCKFFVRCELVFRAGKCLCVRGVHSFTQHGKIAQKTLVATTCTVALAGLLFLFAATLLQQSDTNFANVLGLFTIEFHLPTVVWSCLFQFMLSLPIGAYFFGLFSHGITQTQAPYAKELDTLCQGKERLRMVSQNVLGALLLAFVALYALYFGVQIDYFGSAFLGELPDTLTFSEYARQGFFELCKVMLLNVVLLALVAKLSVIPLRQTRFLKGSAYALMGASLLFAVTALAKLVLYISAYGFTDLRLLSCWGIFVLSVAVMLAVRSIATATPVIANLVYLAVGSFVVVSFLGV